ncbi:MAG: transposase, partial [Labilithrix sp.]|nr:transposase [Labilithrix sp.]
EGDRGCARLDRFERDDHATLCAYVVTTHGRATPLTWKTVKKSTLAGKRNDYEYEVIDRLHSALPPDVAVILLADRAFGDPKLYALLESLGWDYVIRFCGRSSSRTKVACSRRLRRGSGRPDGQR